MLSKLWKPENRYFWDPTFFVGDDDKIHMIYLVNDKDLQPHERHEGTRYARATTEDLRTITDHGEIMSPDEDEVSLWTGNTIILDGVAHMLHTIRGVKGYEGLKKEEPTWLQSIGYATSKDLSSWQRQNESQPVSTADNEIYAMWDSFSRIGNPVAYRDPEPFFDHKKGDLYMAFSAREAGDDQNFNACIGLAKSTDGFTAWENKEPLIKNLGIGEAEVPQVIYFQDAYYVFFATHGNSHRHLGGNDLGSGLYGFRADSLDGKFEPLNGDGIVMDYKNGSTEIIYGVRLLQPQEPKDASAGNFAAAGWVNMGEKERYPGSPEAGFIGALSPAFTIQLKGKEAHVKDLYTPPAVEK